MANRKKYLFHLVNRSCRPFIVSIGLFFVMSAFGFCLMNLKPIFFKGDLFLFAFIFVIYNIKKWYNEVITESTFSGFHTIIVQLGLKAGFILFIISEIMLFFGFFWAFFHVSLCPDKAIGLIWPPIGINIIEPIEIPLFNTLLLLLSGFSLTWTHIALSNKIVKDVIDSWLITLILGSFFLFLQVFEYYESSFNFNDSVYACTFYMLTGLHGFHVFAGVSFLFICFFRYINKHFNEQHHLGFLFAAWYWHFVDIVWILLFLVVYIWGGGFITNAYWTNWFSLILSIY